VVGELSGVGRSSSLEAQATAAQATRNRNSMVRGCLMPLPTPPGGAEFHLCEASIGEDPDGFAPHKPFLRVGHVVIVAACRCYRGDTRKGMAPATV
jgi:hypothetical protein